ncbi:MAG: hypothetical protein K0S65_5605 [Labilithrix sp.]|nr:hypothetical protein [Labilithrix sp.]
MGEAVQADRLSRAAERLRLSAYVALVLTASAAAAVDLAAQPLPGVERFWLAVGVGGGILEESGAAFSVDFARQRDARLLALHATAVLAGYEFSHIAGEIGVLYGRASTGSGAARWNAAAGLSFVQVDISGRELRNTVGLPISVQGSLDAPHVGIGMAGFANLNPAEPYVGLLLTLRVGRLR